jgi:predicted membrane protein
MEDTSLLIWGMIFGAIGLGFFMYGKKQKAVVPLITGIALFVFPYFISNVYALVTVGAGLVVLPYFVRL